MSKPAINGKLPISQKPKTGSSPVAASDVFGNALALPTEIAEELKAKGLTPRWINATDLYKMGGYHAKGWVPYKRPATIPAEFKFGSDPDGVIRRGDCILAVKTEEAVSKHKAYLKQRADAQKGVQSKHAQELREMAGRAQSSVVEGYDEDDE